MMLLEDIRVSIPFGATEGKCNHVQSRLCSKSVLLYMNSKLYNISITFIVLSNNKDA